MTTREFYTAITSIDTIPTELRDFAAEQITKMDAANSARKAKTAEKAIAKAAERKPQHDAVMAVLTDKPATATTLIELAGLDIKPQALRYLIASELEDGTIVKEPVKVEGKKGTQVGYKLA